MHRFKVLADAAQSALTPENGERNFVALRAGAPLYPDVSSERDGDATIVSPTKDEYLTARVNWKTE